MLNTRFFILAALVAATPALAQEATVSVASTDTSSKPAVATAAVTDTQPTKKSTPKVVRYYTPAIEIQHIRPLDQRGLNVFESPKEAARSTGLQALLGRCLHPAVPGPRRTRTPRTPRS